MTRPPTHARRHILVIAVTAGTVILAGTCGGGPASGGGDSSVPGDPYLGCPCLGRGECPHVAASNLGPA